MRKVHGLKSKNRQKASEEKLVAAGKMRLPKAPLKVNDLVRIPTGKVANNEATQALLDDRESGL